MCVFMFLGRENNFDKAQSSMIDSQGIGYDYRSVMHYSANAFSKNGQATIDPKVYKYVIFVLYSNCYTYNNIIDSCYVEREQLC